MARAAFVVDRAMGRIGLEGRAFVALLSSYACAVPGIMATRTIPSPRNRLVTILVAPLMTCSARLPVYALLIGAFVPARKVVGPIGLQGLVLLGAVRARRGRRGRRGGDPEAHARPRRGAARSTSSSRPTACRRRASSLYQVWGAARAFLRRAGTIILARLDRALGAPRVPARRAGARRARRSRPRGARRSSRASPGGIGHAIEPVIAPLGFDWKIGVGLVASLAAREVIVATLAQIYARPTRTRARSATRSAPTVDPRTGRARLHARDGRRAPRLLRLRAPVHVDPRRDAPRDQLLALAGSSPSATSWRSPTARASLTHRLASYERWPVPETSGDSYAPRRGAVAGRYPGVDASLPVTLRTRRPLPPRPCVPPRSLSLPRSASPRPPAARATSRVPIYEDPAISVDAALAEARADDGAARASAIPSTIVVGPRRARPRAARRAHGLGGGRRARRPRSRRSRSTRSARRSRARSRRRRPTRRSS